MNWKLILLGLVVLLLLVGVGYYMKNSGIFKQGFQNNTSNKNEFILYYADWCPHCTTTLPEFNKLHTNGVVTVNGKEVHCKTFEATANPKIMEEKGIKGYPTLKFSSASGETVEYSGGRTTADFLAFLNKQLGGGV